jgi:hypothetical protein
MAVPVLALAMTCSTAFAQTYKPAFETKTVMAGSGTDVTNTTTITAGANASPLTWTLPPDNGAAVNYFLMNNGSGILTWASPTGSIQHDATLKITAGVLGIDLSQGNTWTGDQLLPADATQGDNLVSSVNAGTTAIGAGHGGTGQTSYTAGDILYASGAAALSKLGIGGANTVLHGGASAPSYSAVVNGDITDGTIANVKLVNSTTAIGSTGSTLTFTGGNGSGAIALGGTAGNFDINLAHANAWTAQQTYTDATANAAAATFTNSFGNASGTALGATVSATGASVGTNTALQLTASGATAANNAIDVTAGNVHLAPLTASLPVKTDASQNLTSAAIGLSTIDVTGVLPIANGGTNSNTALSGNTIMISNGSAIVQGTAGTTTTVLHGNASGSPDYGAVVNADITDGTIANVKLVNSTTAIGSTGSTLTFTGGNGSGAIALGGTAGNFDINLAHPNTWTGTQTFGGVAYSVNSPTQLAANTNDWTLSASNSYFLISASTPVNVTGILGGASGRVIMLVNTGNSAITLKNANGGSAPTNQFHLQGGSDIILATDGTATLIYDGTGSYWRLISAQ